MAAPRPTIPVEMTPELSDLVGAWFDLAEKLATVKAAELDARNALFNHFYKADDPKRNQSGTEKFGMPAGWALEIERRLNWKVDEAALAACTAEINELPPDPETGELPSIDACIKFKPQFSESGYRSLRDDVRLILDEALESKPGTPGIELTKPKNARS